MSTVDAVWPASVNIALENSAKPVAVDNESSVTVGGMQAGTSSEVVHVAVQIAWTLFWTIFLTYLRYRVQQRATTFAAGLGEKTSKKYAESVWKVLVYGFAWPIEIALLYDAGVFSDITVLWHSAGPYAVHSIPLRAFYLWELAFDIHSLICHVAMEVRRSDYWSLLAHHIVTIALVLLSYLTGYVAGGLAVLACHDFNDIVFEAAKTCVYRKQERWATGLFAAFMLSWIVTRLYLFPFKVMYSLRYDAPKFIPVHPVTVVCFWLMVFLVCLHWYWFSLIARMAWKMLFTADAKVSDSREHDD